MTIRPILDGILVRMEPPAEMTAGGLYIPDTARADVGTWRAQREAKIGVVLAVGVGAEVVAPDGTVTRQPPGRRRKRRTAWQRDKRKQGLPKPEEIALMWDSGSEGALIPMDVKVGDRVLFDNAADLRPVDPDDPLLRMGAAFQVAEVLDTAESRGGVEYEMGGRTW